MLSYHKKETESYEKQKIQSGGGIRTLSVLTLAFVISLSTANTAAFAATSAPDDGQRISYTSRDSFAREFRYGSGSDAFSGSCIQVGNEAASSGTATANKVSNNSKMAKIAYYYGEKKGWWGDDSSGGSLIGIPTAQITKAGVVQLMLQAQNQGYSNWKSIATGGGFITANVCDAIIDMLQDTDWGSIQVPDGFEMYTLDCGNDQDGSIWRFQPTGKLKVSKTLARGTTGESFTFRIKVTGADGTYSGVTFSSGVATITLTGGQSKTIEGLPAGASYTVTEIDLPANWHQKSKSGDTGTIREDSTASAAFVNERDTGYVKVKKRSGNTDITG